MQNVNWNLIAEQESVAYKTGFLNALQIAGVEGLGPISGRTVNLGNIGRLPARRAVRGNGRVAASSIANGSGLQSKVADVLKDHPGIAAPEIAKLAGIPGQRAQALLARMRANKTLKATGKRGSRHYWLKGTQPAASAST